jgi:hypothetical protein
MPKVRIKPTPLSESDGTPFGHHVEKPSALTRQIVNGVEYVEDAPLTIEQRVNDTTYIAPGRKY